MTVTKSISIIMPVYKVPVEFLRVSIESVLQQSFSDFEFLIVGDGIPEEAVRAVIREYAGKDSRIRFFDLEQNGGVAAARNLALRECRGEFIGFIDSDDFIDRFYYEKLIVAAQSEHADMVWCGGCRANGETLFKHKKPPFQIVHGDVSGKLIQYKHLDTSVCTKLYRTAAVAGIEFPEQVANGEDFGFNFQVFWSCATTVSLDYDGYRYRIQSADAARRQDPGVRVLRSTERLIRFLAGKLPGMNMENAARKACVIALLRLYVRYANKLWRVEDTFVRAELHQNWNRLFDEVILPWQKEYPLWISRLQYSFGGRRNFSRLDVLVHRAWLGCVDPGKRASQ